LRRRRYERCKNVLPRDWRRVEAARHALFKSATPPDAASRPYLGHGILRVDATLRVAPVLNLP
jgi:hypothetical protein